MASFSVDITDIKFAGGRTGYKVVKISNAPAAGINISNTGYGNYFRLIQQVGYYYRISTKFVNTSGSSYTSYIRFYNRNDVSDYVDVNVEQYSVTNIAIYGDGVYDSGSQGFYGLDVGYSMGSSSVYIDSYNGEGVSGTVTSGDSWLSCVSGTPAVTDTGFISYNLAYITNYDSSRTGEVYFETGTSHYNLTLSVYQAGDAPVERLYVSPSSLSFTSSGGTKAIDVIQYRGSTLNYDMTEVSSWASISLSQVMTGVMTGSVTTAVNASTAQRTGSIWFSDVSGSISLPIAQDGQAVTLSASPSSLSFTSGGGTKTLAVTFAGDLNSNAANMPEWLDQSYVSVGQSSRTYTVQASSNNTVSSRSFSWIFQDDNMEITVPVTQAAGSAPVQNISVTPSVINVGAAAATDVVTLNYVSGSYRYDTDGAWLSLSHLDDPSEGNTRYTLNIAANTGVSPRTGQIDFISESGYGSCSLVVNQAGNDEMTVTPSTVSFSSSGGSGSVQVYYVSGGYMNVSAGLHPDWVTNFGVGSSGSYTATFMFDITANSGVNRYGYVHINNTYNSKSCRLLVTQTGSGPSFSVSPSSLSFSAAGGSQTISFTGIQTSGLEYEIVSGSDWLGFSFSDNKVLADTNTGSARTGSIRFRNNLFSSDYVTVTVSQAAGSGPVPVESGLTVDKDFVVLRRGDFGNNSDYLYFNKSGLSYDVFYTDGSGWLSVNITGSTAYIEATDNSGVSRNARIKFYTSASDYVYVNVVQASGTYIYIPIWQDYYYRPADYQVGEDYHYRLVDHSNNEVLFEGITVAKSTDDYDDYIDDINIPRLIENYVSSGDNSYGEQIDNYSGYWSRLNGSIEVDFYNADTDQLIDSFKFFNDWSDLYYEDYQKYGLIDYNKTLNDPINFKGCQYMEIPFCVYDDSRTRSYSVGNTSLGTLPEDFCVFTNNAYTGNKVDFKRGSTVLFSYDLRHCGNGYLVYRNRFGGWDSFLIEGNISKKESYNRDNYTKKADNISVFNREKFTNSNSIVTSYEFSTGWLSEEESARFVYHLLSSPSVNLYVLDDCMIDYRNGGSGPGEVTITNSEAEYKKFKNGRRLVNYTVSVDVAYKTKVQR